MFRKLLSRDDPMLTNLLAAVEPGAEYDSDVGEASPPSGGVLLGFVSDMGRGTGRATGGGGGSRKEPGILPWPLPFGCVEGCPEPSEQTNWTNSLSGSCPGWGW